MNDADTIDGTIGRFVDAQHTFIGEMKAEIKRLQELAGHDAVLLRPDVLRAVDERSRITGLPRESIVNSILTAAFTFEQEDLDRIMRHGQQER